jgi:hypothetical protein
MVVIVIILFFRFIYVLYYYTKNHIKVILNIYYKMHYTRSTSSPNFSASASGSTQFSGPVTRSRSKLGFGAPSTKSYVSNGFTMNSNGYLANPTRAAQQAANNAGALTRSEAARMGLSMGGRR